MIKRILIVFLFCFIGVHATFASDMPTTATTVIGYVLGLETFSSGDVSVILDKNQTITNEGSAYTVGSESMGWYLLKLGNVNSNPNLKIVIANLLAAKSSNTYYAFELSGNPDANNVSWISNCYPKQ